MRDVPDKLWGGEHIVVGTPRSVFDKMSERHLRIDDLLTCICDEAGEMLSRGFQESDLHTVKTLLPSVQHRRFWTSSRSSCETRCAST